MQNTLATSLLKRQRRTKAQTEELISVIIDILDAHHPMTVRQVYYQLVSRQLIDNKRTAYQAVSRLIVKARISGLIPWEWVEDRLRKPRTPSMWRDLPHFITTVQRAYRRD